MVNIGALSYGAAAFGWLVLFLLLLIKWRGCLQGGLLLAAALTSLLWAMRASFYAATQATGLDWLYLFLEVARNVTWLLFLTLLLEPLVRGNWADRSFLWIGSALVSYGTLLLGIELGELLGVGIPFEAPTDAAILGHVGLAIAGLVLIEQLFRNTHRQWRGATRFFYLGLGLMFAYDFFLYTHALLFKSLSATMWEVRGLVGAMIVPLIGVAAIHHASWTKEAFVDRRMVFYPTTIFGAGIYTLTIAVVGYYVKAYGDLWSPLLHVAFMASAGILLAVFLFSQPLRAKGLGLRNKDFFSYKYDYREEWLKFVRTLSTGESNEPLRQRAIRAAAEIVQSPGGLLWTRRERGNFTLQASWNLNEPEVRQEPANTALVRFLQQHQAVFELGQYVRNPELYADLTLPHWLWEVPDAWLVVPLPHGDALKGFLVLAQNPTGPRLTWEDRDLLQTAGQQVASFIVLLEANEALWEARQFEAFHRLAAYVVHDLKNIAAQLALVVANANRHKTNPLFVEDAFRTVANATERMNRLLGQLRKDPPSGRIWLGSLTAAARQAVAARAARRPVPALRIDPDDDPSVRVDQERLAAVLEHLIQNAQEATTENGLVEVAVFSEEQMAVVAIRDDGCGMDERFMRERLFRPFSTTKGNAGMGIGVYESYEFARGAGGELTATSAPGEGATFFLRLPRIENPGATSKNQETAETIINEKLD
jgi:putative PEP-CTERM system histidine kinase